MLSPVPHQFALLDGTPGTEIATTWQLKMLRTSEDVEKLQEEQLAASLQYEASWHHRMQR